MDAVDEEDGVGRGSESAKGGIDEELEGADDGRYDEEELSDDWTKIQFLNDYEEGKTHRRRERAW